MAIEITTFEHYASNNTNNRNEVLSWLQTNASQYFSTITASEGAYGSPQIQMSNSDHSSIVLSFNAGQNYSAQYTTTKRYEGSQGAITYWQGDDSKQGFIKAAKTPYGICLCSYPKGETIWFTKTNEETTAFALFGRTNHASASQVHLWFGDWHKSSDLFTFDAATTEGTVESMKNVLRRNTHGKTVLTPLALDGGTYTENFFLVPFTSYVVNTDILKVTFDGTEYLYDGLFALKG